MKYPVIDVRHVAVTYVSGPVWSHRLTRAVAQITFEIAQGETLGLVGESGSGKTTLGRVCLGLTPATAGAVLFERQLIGPNNKPPPGTLSVVLQHPDWALNPRLTVGTSVAEPLAILRRETRSDKFARAQQALQMVGLEGSFVNRYPHELSGGQRQRVAIARALVTEPRFIVFDEPVSALDASVQTQVLNVIKDLQQAHGFAALFISHDLAATRYVSDRIAVMHAGLLLEMSPARSFYGAPLHPYSRALSMTADQAGGETFALEGGGEEMPLVGCPFALRCPMNITRCHEETPELRELGAAQVACHRAEEIGDVLPEKSRTIVT